MDLAFVETAVFTKRWVALGLEGTLRGLQEKLGQAPDAGSLDPGTGGLRKLRIPDPSRGKGTKGGARVHYLWLPHAGVIYLMYVYSKDEADTLSPGQKLALRAIVQLIKARHR